MFGGMGGGPGGPPGAPQAGLPFGGIPHELQSGVDHLLSNEPERGEPDIEFTQVPSAAERRHLTLTSLLTVYPSMLILAGVLVSVIALASQLGPSLVEYAINHGLTPPHNLDFGIVVVCAVQGLTMVVITVILFFTNVRLATITVVAVLPPLIVMSIWFKRASERGYEKVRDGIALVLADLSESLQGVRIVTAHNRQRYNVEHHRNVVGWYRDANLYTGRINGIYGPGSQLISVIGQVLILGIGGEMYLHHQLTIGALTAFFLYVNRFFAPIQLLVQQYNTFQQGRASVFKLQDLLENEPSVLESPTATELPPIEGEIRFDHVTFAYNPDAIVLDDIDLTIHPGETVAFVGATGAGKSTMAKLITRFYDPTAGRVLIDGHDLRDVTLASLRRQLGVVPQEPFLFAGTIRDNISFARPGSPDDQVWEAVNKTGLTELVHRLPYGLDTIVHERGQSLSSGERQLIALARAFMAQPRVLVLDEATSNLDLQSETKIEAALDVLLQQRTAVLIAHRLSTAMRADRIVVVGDGTLLEVGSHDELIALGGHYADMYATWISQSHAA
jgi:ATP-binding cassette subfamily B protein